MPNASTQKAKKAKVSTETILEKLQHLEDVFSEQIGNVVGQIEVIKSDAVSGLDIRDDLSNRIDDVSRDLSKRIDDVKRDLSDRMDDIKDRLN